MDAADQVFVSDAGTSLKKADIAAIAKYIVENYAGSTIGDSAQSVQAAIGALNSSIGGFAVVTYTTDVSITNMSDLLPVLNANTFSELPVGVSVIDVVKGSAHRATIICGKLNQDYGSALVISYYSGLNNKWMRYYDGAWAEWA